MPYRAPSDPRPYVSQTGGDALSGAPRRVGHVNMLVANAKTVSAFYEQALGLRVSDWIGDGAVWLRTGAWHHEIAMLEKSPTHFHHLAFELADFGQMRETLDHVAQRGRWVSWGPGRHAMAQNLFAYVRMPDEECFVELYCDMEILPDDHTPREWPDNVHSSNAWGTLPPRTYFRFDAESVRIEREQLMQLGLEFIPADERACLALQRERDRDRLVARTHVARADADAGGLAELRLQRAAGSAHRADRGDDEASALPGEDRDADRADRRRERHLDLARRARAWRRRP